MLYYPLNRKHNNTLYVELLANPFETMFNLSQSIIH